MKINLLSCFLLLFAFIPYSLSSPEDSAPQKKFNLEDPWHLTAFAAAKRAIYENPKAFFILKSADKSAAAGSNDWEKTKSALQKESREEGKSHFLKEMSRYYLIDSYKGSMTAPLAAEFLSPSEAADIIIENDNKSLLSSKLSETDKLAQKWVLMQDDCRKNPNECLLNTHPVWIEAQAEIKKLDQEEGFPKAESLKKLEDRFQEESALANKTLSLFTEERKNQREKNKKKFMEEIETQFAEDEKALDIEIARQIQQEIEQDLESSINEQIS